METEKLYNMAAEDGIKLDFFPLPENKSVSLLVGDRCFIAVDPNFISTAANERVCLAHEIGHCRTGGFYNMYSPLDVRAKHEYKADKWAITRLVPYEEFLKAVKRGCGDVYSLAEYFSVTEDFMRKAIEFYNEKRTR